MTAEFLSATEAAALLRCSVWSVCRLARMGRLPAFRVGRLWRFRRSELLAMSGG